MQEQLEKNNSSNTPASEGLAAPDISGAIAKAQSVLNQVHVIHGANEGYFPLSGKTVGSVRKSLREVYNIPGDAFALVNGQQVEDDFVLLEQNSLEFTKTAGTKGLL